MYLRAVGPHGERVFKSLEVPVDVQPAAPTCSVRTHTHSHGGWFFTTVVVRNLGDHRIDGWTLDYEVGDGDTVRSMWNANYVQTGAAVSASNTAHNATIRPHAARAFGYTGTHSGAVGTPSDFALNGAPCAVMS